MIWMVFFRLSRGDNQDGDFLSNNRSLPSQKSSCGVRGGDRTFGIATLWEGTVANSTAPSSLPGFQ